MVRLMEVQKVELFFHGNDQNEIFLIKIKVMHLSQNKLIIDTNEEDRYLYMSNLIQYLDRINFQYFYLFFGYSEGNINIYEYTKKYPQLIDDKGFIKLKNEDKINYTLITDLLFEYQMAGLYINNKPDLDEKYIFPRIRDDYHHSLFGGYAIFVQEGEGPLVYKDNNIPNWDTTLLNIPLSKIWVEDISDKWILASDLK